MAQCVGAGERVEVWGVCRLRKLPMPRPGGERTLSFSGTQTSSSSWSTECKKLGWSPWSEKALEKPTSFRGGLAQSGWLQGPQAPGSQV